MMDILINTAAVKCVGGAEDSLFLQALHSNLVNLATQMAGIVDYYNFGPEYEFYC